MRATLVREDTLGARQPIALEQLPVVIGRSPASGICIEDRFASRRHCELMVADGALLVRDLGSTHGIVVNGSSVMEARLNPGDRLSIGLSTFIVEYQPECAAQTSNGSQA